MKRELLFYGRGTVTAVGDKVFEVEFDNPTGSGHLWTGAVPADDVTGVTVGAKVSLQMEYRTSITGDHRRITTIEVISPAPPS